MKILLPEKISLNSFYAGVHWSKRNKIVNEYHLAVWVCVKQQKIAPPTHFPVKVVYNYHIKGKLLDLTNLPTKLVEDGLVRAGIFPDDSLKYINEITIREQKSKENYVEVIIT